MSTDRQSQKEATTGRILAGALQEFALHGYEKTRLVDIAKRAQVANGLPSQRFGSKKCLFLAVVKEMLQPYFDPYSEGLTFSGLMELYYRDLLQGAQTSSDRFLFVMNCYSDKAVIPMVTETIKEMFMVSGLYVLMLKEQQGGHLPEGDILRVLTYFVRDSITIARDYANGDIALPTLEDFYRLLMYKNDRNAAVAFADIFLGTFVSAYLVDTRDNSYVVQTRRTDVEAKYPAQELPDFFDSLKKYIENDVLEEDRAFIYEATRKDAVLRRLDKEGEFMQCFRDTMSGTPRYFDIQFLKADENHFACTFKDVDTLVQDRADNENKQALLSAFIEDYSSVFLCDFTDNQVKAVKVNSDIAEFLAIKEDSTLPLSELLECLRQNVLPEDREEFLRVLDPDFLRSSDQNSQTFHFRDLIPGGSSEYCEGFWKRLGSDCVLFGFVRRNDEILEQLANDILLKEFTFIFTVDIKSGQYTVLRDYNPNYNNTRFDKGDYITIMDRMLAEVTTEDRQKLEAIATCKGLAAFSQTAASREITYRATRETQPYVRIITRVIGWRDGVPSTVFMGFTVLDELSSEQLEMERIQKENMSVISTLSQDFDYIGFYMPKTNTLRTLVARNELAQIANDYRSVLYSVDHATDFSLLYKAVCAQENLPAFAAAIENALRESEKCTNVQWKKDVDFRSIYSPNKPHCLLRFAKAPEVPDRILLGIRSSENEWRQKRSNEVMDIIASEYNSVYYIDMTSNLYEICTANDMSREETAGFLTRYPNYVDAMTLYIDNLVHPDDQQRMIDVLNNIRNNLLQRKSTSVWFRRRYDNAYLYTIMSCVKVDDASCEPTRVVVTFTEKNHDYLQQQKIAEQQRRNERILEILGSDYSSVYYGDVLENTFDVLMQTDRIAALFARYEGENTFSGCFRYFVDTAVHASDRNELRKITDMSFLRKQFAQSNAFTFVYRNELGSYCELKVSKSTESEAGIVIGIADKDAQYREQRLQEQAVRSCVSLLSDTSTPENGLSALLADVGEFYEADRVYILEYDSTNDRYTSEYKWVAREADNLTDIDTRSIAMLMEAFSIREGFDTQDTASAQESIGDRIAAFLAKYNLGSTHAYPLMENGRITALLCMDKPKARADDTLLLKTASSVGQYLLLRRRQSSEDHLILNKIAKNYVGVYQINLQHDRVRAFYVSPESDLHADYEGAFGKSVSLYANTRVAVEDRERFLQEMRPENIRRHMQEDGGFSVSFNRITGKVSRTYEVSFLTTGSNPDMLILCCSDMTDLLLEQQLLFLQEQRKLEQTVQERTTELRDKNDVLIRMNEDVVELLGNITEARDVESGEHIRRVKGYSYILAEEIMSLFPEYGITESMVDIITSASALHDIGKISIPDAILLKPGRFTKEEFEIMKSHTTLGALILEKAPKDWSADYLKVSKEIALCHHEKWDGRGYPAGLKGNEIPISAQIVSVADCFDALTTKRVYKDAYTPEKAYEMILGGECGEFSDKMMQAFRNCKDSFVQHTLDTSSRYTGNLPVGVLGNSLTAKRILLAEDNLLSREMAQELLEEQGAIVFCAENGEEAVRLFTEKPNGTFDFILMDMIMPVMDGITATETIRGSDKPYAKTIPIFALTVSDGETRRSITNRQDITAVLTKPLNIDRLRELI